MPLAALADLVLGVCCPGCGALGPGLCARCERELQRPALAQAVGGGASWDGTVVAGGRYDGVLRAAIVAHKEQGRSALARPLGVLLARAVAAVVDESDRGDGGGGVVLVPVPSRPSARRSRGRDPLFAVVTAARAYLLRGEAAVPVGVWRGVRVRGRVADQAGLSVAQRSRNVAGAFAVRRSAPPLPPGLVIMVDDVCTTGATLRALAAACDEVLTQGRPLHAATVALVPEPASRAPRVTSRRPARRNSVEADRPA
jgi:predicted amidophosphoribosyltransferase